MVIYLPHTHKDVQHTYNSSDNNNSGQNMSAKFQNIIRPSFVILRIQGLECNSVDSEEAMHNELPCLGLPCLQKLFSFLTLGVIL